MSEAGASRRRERRQRIDITLSVEIVRYLDSKAKSRSRQIEETIKATPDFIIWQKKEGEHVQ